MLNEDQVALSLPVKPGRSPKRASHSPSGKPAFTVTFLSSLSQVRTFSLPVYDHRIPSSCQQDGTPLWGRATASGILATAVTQERCCYHQTGILTRTLCRAGHFNTLTFNAYNAHAARRGSSRRRRRPVRRRSAETTGSPRANGGPPHKMAPQGPGVGGGGDGRVLRPHRFINTCHFNP